MSRFREMNAPFDANSLELPATIESSVTRLNLLCLEVHGAVDDIIILEKGSIVSSVFARSKA